MVGLPAPQDTRIRVRRVVAPDLDQLEGVTNTALSELQHAGQRIISVQFEIPQDTARRTSAFILYDDRVGSDTERAQGRRDGAKQVVDQIARLRDQVSGVSLDEEAAAMMKYQRAYEANARFFTAVNDTLTTLMNIV